MDDLISRRAAIEEFQKELSTGKEDGVEVIAAGLTLVGIKQVLERLPSAQSWILGMPEEYGNYLVTVEDLKGDRWVDIDYYASYGWDDYSERDGWKVYAWMPLPKVWEGEEHE